MDIVKRGSVILIIRQCAFQLPHGIGHFFIRAIFFFECKIAGIFAGTLTAQAKTIEAKADLILLNGYVKASELETEVLTVVDSARVIGYLSGSDIDVQSLVAGSVNGEYGSFDSITVDSMTINGSTAATQAWVQAQGYLTEIPTGTMDGFVTGNDVRGYCEALYATKTELSDYVLASSITKISKYVVTKVTPTVNTSGNVTNVTYSGEYISFYT